MAVYFLTDNGSLRAASTWSLRRIADSLAGRAGETVVPASLLHSAKVDPAELGGRAAETLEAAIVRRLEEGERMIGIVPLFFGPSRALTGYLPRRLKRVQEDYPDARIEVAPSLVDPLDGIDSRVAEMLRDRVAEQLPEDGRRLPVVLVDHGSPAPEVVHVRDFVTGQLSVLLRGRVERLAACSMERRPGEEYRFSGPLLEEVLELEPFSRGEIIVAMMFLSPGRHAGEGGDVAEICERACQRNHGLRIRRTQLLGDHPLLIELLADRLQSLRQILG